MHISHLKQINNLNLMIHSSRRLS